ncbi:MAG: glycosyltransferase family 4 protein [Bacillaceae bacterium]|nr:glycosyltransferase family 4 protein [Bacillaceae bacterium]
MNQNVTHQNKVLVVAYLFPPIGGIGVQRPLKMVKYLRDFGWEPFVLTVDPVYHATYDESLLQEIPEDVTVERVPQTDPTVFLAGNKSVTSTPAQNQTATDLTASPGAVSRMKQGALQAARSMAKHIKDMIFVPDDQVLWYLRARRRAVEMVRKHDIDVIYTTSGPHSDLLVGRYVKQKTGVPWIAEFRDPWTQNIHFSATGMRKKIEERMEERVMRDADVIVTVTDSFARDFKTKYPWLDRIKVIHNGFDPDDYQGIEPVPHDGKFTLVYTGILYGKRHPRYFLQALHQLIEEGKIPRDKVRVKFAGVFDYPGQSENIDFVKRHGLDDVVDVLGYLPHKKALAHLKGADVQLLIGDTAPRSGAYIPGKLFEYMALEKPILALSLPGESTRIVDEFKLGISVDPVDISAIQDAIYRLYQDWQKGETGAQKSRSDGLHIYRRDEQARMLAEIMSNLL